MRETGPIRKCLSGDIDLATAYIPHARTILGGLKDEMKVGNTPTGTRVQMQPDGTRIIVKSFNGTDSVFIDSPVQSGKKHAAHHAQQEHRNVPYIWVGARIGSGGLDDFGDLSAQLHLCVWEPGKDRDIISNRNHIINKYDAE